MSNVEKMFKDKRILIGIIIFLFIISCLIIIKGFSKNNSGKNDKEVIENTYTMYIKINPLVKLTIKEVYQKCDSENENACNEYTDEVISYELINDDAKTIYDGIDLNGKSFIDALILLTSISKDKDIDINNIEITTDWNVKYSEDEISKIIKEKVDNDVTVKINYQKQLDEKTILDKENIKNFTVTFDSNYGTFIEKQIVIENSTVIKPNNPSRDGYYFVEWQLDNETYDFNKIVTNDITLIAVWNPIENYNDINNENNNNSNNSNIPNQNEEASQTEIKKYKITFNSDNGTSIDSKLVEENNLVTKPNDPVKNGYKFLGWYNNNSKFDFNTKINQDITLVAKWEKIITTTTTTTKKTTTVPITTTTTTTTTKTLTYNYEIKEIADSTTGQCYIYIINSNGVYVDGSLTITYQNGASESIQISKNGTFWPNKSVIKSITNIKVN